MKTFLEHILLIEDRAAVVRDKYYKLIWPYVEPVFINRFKSYSGEYNPDKMNLNADSSLQCALDDMEFADPTPNKAYFQWICQTFVGWLKNPQAGGYIRIADVYSEDKYAIKQDLELFDRVKARMPANQRDINQYKTYHDLRVAILPYEQTISKTQEDKDYIKKLYDSKQITIVYQGPEGKVEIPNTIEASKYLGRGTRWCTAAEKNNYFDHYNKKGKLYVFTSPKGNKWQFHLETESFMDANDMVLTQSQMSQSQLVRKASLLIINKLKPKNPEEAYDYLMWFPWEHDNHLADMIAADSTTSFLYARDVLKGRFIKGEKAIATGAGYKNKGSSAVVEYAIEILKGEFKAGEKLILEDAAAGYATLALKYLKYIKKGDWPELKKILLDNGFSQDIGLYVFYSGKPWPEGEALCKSGGEKQYRDFLYWSKGK